MRRRLLVANLAAILTAATAAPSSDIVVHRGVLRSTHRVPVEVRAPATYRILRPTSRHATFDGHPYRVTLAAFAAMEAAVMFHAEQVADDSGHSNYDDLPPSPYAGFRRRSQCASIAPEDVAEEHDLKWLSDRGWNPVGSIALEQHFRSTRDHNQEVVVSLVARVKDCNDKQDVESKLQRLRKDVRIRRL